MHPTSWRLAVPRRCPPALRALLLASAVLVLLAACGAARMPSASRATASDVGVASAAASTAGRAAVARAPATNAEAAHGGATASQAQPLPNLQVGQMLIRTASIEIEASDPAAVMTQVQQIAAAATAGADAGYVSDEHTQYNGNVLTATITIQVPSPAFANVMDQLRRQGTRVVSETSNSQDVTEQYVDVDAQLQALRATQTQLLQLLAKTTQLTDTLAVQRELEQVETQINQLEGRENYLKAHSAFSAITATIHPPAGTPTPQPLPNWSPLRTLLAAASALGIFGQGVVDFLIWLLVFGLPTGAAALIVFLVYRTVARSLRQRRSRPAA